VLQLEENLLRRMLNSKYKDSDDDNDYLREFETIICSEILKIPVTRYNKHGDFAAFISKDRNDIKPIIHT
jgi:hypothetical protein